MGPSLPPTNNGTQATIDDLPDELLGLIFRQLLPWLHRVRVEGVSKRFQRVALAHGWADVREFSTESRINERNELREHPTWWGPLLSRVGPRVKHLSMCWELLDPPTALEHIGRAYATTLKTLKVWGYVTYSTAAVRGLSEALSNLSTLECLHIYNCNQEAFMQELHLSARPLANLRHLALHAHGDWVLSEENIDVVVALPRLRSFTLSGFHQLSFLQRFPHLEHLHIERGISDENTESLIEALPHLGRTLKALRFYKYVGKERSLLLFERLLAALVEHLPMLEHLEVSFYVDELEEKVCPLIQKKMLDPLASSPRLQNLRSLSLRGQLAPLSWAWLEGMSQRLEYLELGVMPPLSTLCSIVESGKNLRGLKLDTCGASLSAADRKLLVEASYAPANTCSSDGGKSVVQPKLVLPTLHIGITGAFQTREELEYENSTTHSRVRFSQEDSSELRSHVLDSYRFGCLSEGRPSFIEE